MSQDTAGSTLAASDKTGVGNAMLGVVGAGAMGTGIAQVAATSGHNVLLFDADPLALEKASLALQLVFKRLVEKQKHSQQQAEDILSRIQFVTDLRTFNKCFVVIEAVIEDLLIKQQLFSDLEKIVAPECVLATNTSSLSITSIASACERPKRVIGIHFFNPAPVMPLVEIIPALTTDETVSIFVQKLLTIWGKKVVLAKDTPGFIVNRLARSFYGEAIRIYEEGIADFATIDWAMKSAGGFKMGPFELMDFIGIDVNYKVTESVWQQFYNEPRFQPSITQKRYFEAKWYGCKTGKGFYDYADSAVNSKPIENKELGSLIFNRVIAMLINEAVDSLYLKLASKDDLDLAMIAGVNYPKGLLKWGDEIGLKNVLETLQNLHNLYGEDRYRPCILLRSMANNNQKFYA